ncbi:SDR family NAD(P)-dependent oxidoreductase [Dysgonomonas sp. BGC7]|uniref:SDR family NAD(P)-dependent oxidoreductase n=1 Tax=Dysgonomonas sp. BGC7 TaxID=1658008 RepID=UPI0006812810|nr:SDR family oxidoreductase [Dysgonomonas sp. BGC7]MBD8389503.1 SDR family oxidoreductase [Dysgonomonas sp. BGC7]
MNGVEGKIVFVTGGANGIGRSIVRMFCEAGADVIFCDVDEESSQLLCDELRGYKCGFIKVDISNEKELSNALEGVIAKKGNVDIIINNVGVSRFESILNLSVEDFDKVLDVNLRPIFITAQILAKYRAENESLNTFGRIINMASTRYLMSEPDSEAYAASKGGVVSLTHALSISLSKYRITVNCISPGWIETGDYNNLTFVDHNQHPSGRVGKPEDIARMCLFLSQPENDFITGQNFVIDGGMTKKMIYED